MGDLPRWMNALIVIGDLLRQKKTWRIGRIVMGDYLSGKRKSGLIVMGDLPSGGMVLLW
jgi:hypothetical protein